jgi:hypothetical protein
MAPGSDYLLGDEDDSDYQDSNPDGDDGEDIDYEELAMDVVERLDGQEVDSDEDEHDSDQDVPEGVTITQSSTSTDAAPSFLFGTSSKQIHQLLYIYICI